MIAMPTEPISVLIVDDSAFMRKMLTHIIASDPALTVAGQARDGAEALRLVETLRPDVVTMDIEMPGISGIVALERIMQTRPTPVIMVSSLTHAGAESTLRCLSLGAFDFIGKPSGAISLDIETICDDLIAKIKAAKSAKTHRAASGIGAPVAALLPKPASATAKPPARDAAASAVIVIGASTGGPRALETLLPMLTPALSVPLVIVQHMPEAFTGALAKRLALCSGLMVREAAAGDRLQANTVLVAPGGKHMEFDAGGAVRLTDDPPMHGVRPSIDVTIASLAKLYGRRTLAVLLTGMGKDGARGLCAVRALGGHTIAEDESTCAVYGMPRAAREMDAAERMLPLPEIAPAIAEYAAPRKAVPLMSAKG